MVPEEGLEPTRISPRDFESRVLMFLKIITHPSIIDYNALYIKNNDPVYVINMLLP